MSPPCYTLHLHQCIVCEKMFVALSCENHTSLRSQHCCSQKTASSQAGLIHVPADSRVLEILHSASEEVSFSETWTCLSLQNETVAATTRRSLSVCAESIRNVSYKQREGVMKSLVRLWRRFKDLGSEEKAKAMKQSVLIEHEDNVGSSQQCIQQWWTYFSLKVRGIYWEVLVSEVGLCEVLILRNNT